MKSVISPCLAFIEGPCRCSVVANRYIYSTFSINNWGSATMAYMKSVNKKGDIAIKTTMLMARKLLKKSSSAGLEKYLRLCDASDSEEIDSRAMLW